MSTVVDYLTSGLMPALIGVLILLSVMTTLMRRSSKGVRNFRAGFVTGIVGRKGHGKTILTVHEALRHIGQPVYCPKCTKRADVRQTEAERGFPAYRKGKRWYHTGTIATNGSLKLPPHLVKYWTYVTSWDDLATWEFDAAGRNMTVVERLQHGCLVIVDEMHLWSPAKAGETLPARQKLLLSQLRKLVLEMIYATQNIANVSIGLRRQTDEIGVCRKGMFKRMAVKFWDPEEVQRPGCKSLWSYRYRVTRKLGNAYDTYELIMPAEDSDEQFAADTSRAPGLRPNHRGGGRRPEERGAGPTASAGVLAPHPPSLPAAAGQ